MSKKEILEKMKTAKSWKELSLSLSEVYQAFSDLEDENSGNNQELNDMREKIARLTETNKQLRAENKLLRGVKK